MNTKFVGFLFTAKHIVFPTYRKNIQEISKKYWQTLVLQSIIKYSHRRVTTEYIFNHTVFEQTTLSRTTQRYAKRKYRRFWIALSCQQQISVKDSFDYEFQSRLHLDVITLLPNNKGEVWLFSVGTYHLDVPTFLLPKSRLTTEWPTEWDMILPRPLFRRVSKTTPLDGGRNCIQVKRQKNGRDRQFTVVYRSEQGNCIDSFHFNRHACRLLFGEIPKPL